MSKFSKIFGKGTFSFFACHANNCSKETGVTMARGAAIASLAAAGMSCQGGDPSLCHRSLTDLVPIWDIQKCMGSGAVWALSAWAPVPCLGRQALSTASYLTLVARWIREIRSQQRWAAALPSAEEFERVWHAGSVAGVQGAGSIGDSCPSWVMKDKEDSAGRWCLQGLDWQSSLQGLTCTELQTNVGLCAPQIPYCWDICIYRNLSWDHSWDVITCQTLKRSKWNELVRPHFSPWLEHGCGGETRWKVIQCLVQWALWWPCCEKWSLLQGAGTQDRPGRGIPSTS